MTAEDIPGLLALLDACKKGKLPVGVITYSIRQGDSKITVSVETVPIDEPDQTHPERMN